MALSPFPAGDGRTWPNQAFTTDSGVFSLITVTNGNIALHLEDINNGNQLYVCTGTWAISGDGSQGKADFTPSATDLLSTNPLGKAGLYKAYPVVTLTSGPVPMDFQYIQVVSLP